jgi:hypothetical protein
MALQLRRGSGLLRSPLDRLYMLRRDFNGRHLGLGRTEMGREGLTCSVRGSQGERWRLLEMRLRLYLVRKNRSGKGRGAKNRYRLQDPVV